MRDSSTTSTKSSPLWKPFASNCCSVDDQAVFGNLSRCDLQDQSSPRTILDHFLPSDGSPLLI
ncbi:unnamed protein product [Eruca vesicaria subsp. sativa]|uniref:Uncharacterized protein n=1 Tax=Eruca vesicaria subsp. sativa TaxID=29727 RepID=A0ABC8LV09_ERUVS|nr:unnamed protein product [Eruca vesicaria subsp. sativa]